MDPSLVLKKSAKGREEIEKRTLKLDARRRVMLILVDGQRTAEELMTRGTNPDEAATVLESLLAEGFVESVSGHAVPAAPSGVAVPATSVAPQTSKSLQELQRLASKSIESLLGPEGETMALRLEKTSTVEQFLHEAQKTREALRDFAGQRKADAFWAALGL